MLGWHCSPSNHLLPTTPLTGGGHCHAPALSLYQELAGWKATCERSPGVVSREAGAVVEDHGNPSMSDQPVQNDALGFKQTVFDDLQTMRSAGLAFEGRAVVLPWAS